ncbi:MAG: hypothetical protein K0S27_540 [Gammaproteobacteria bacterium]|jgi:thiazole/oxazole-forming peptide maturase SagD family component|nr:hypothetical protein [Gammaproteobacteria bacterium]
MIKLKVHSRDNQLSPITQLLSRKMLSPLCGIVREIGFLRRSSRMPRIISTGADLTGVHVLLNKPRPGLGGYHIGATGISLNEVLIKTLGESVERYAQLVSEISGRFSTRFLSYSQLVLTEGDAVLPEDRLKIFEDHQFKQAGFPFVQYADQPLDWIKLPSLLSSYSMWIPTQFLLVGYQVKHAKNEPWISPAVTTGTASHVNKVSALINSILELVQIDSAMGHWYSNRQSKRIIFDDRTRNLEIILEKQGYFNHSNFCFYWLENPDLAGFSIACIYRSQLSIPKVAIGLGADVSLIRAMYKAYLEAIGVIGLARMLIFHKKEGYSKDSFYDLDTNVGYYGRGYHYSFIQEKFPLEYVINARDLPADIEGRQSAQLAVLINSFKKSGKELLFCDLTCVEAADLGFIVPRVWSPDTLSLCLPSAPWMQHRRYLNYGGFAHEFPHPYP